MNVIAIDFTGIYENEGFTFLTGDKSSRLVLNEDTFYASFKDVTGTNCICDDYACEEIKKRLRELDINKYKVRFFDSGNYHYMSKLLIDLMCEDNSDKFDEFDIIMFDHHPDMKWTSYGDILSCGSWVLNALKDHEEIGRIYIIGADEKLISEVVQENPEYAKRVTFLHDIDELEKYEITNVYLSIDKDVISDSELATNWNQGNMSIERLRHCLDELKKRFSDRILAVDVCGECMPDDERLFTDIGISASNAVNSMIIDSF